jgi:glycosyltransferase 2 family protein
MNPRGTAPKLRVLLASQRIRLATRLVVGGGVLLFLLARVGAAPFIHGLLSIHLWSIAAALALGAVATAAMAWRWRTIALRLGADIPWWSAVALYYQSQFLNTVLPGGVLGDINRAVVQGRRTESVGGSPRSVVLDRAFGQLVQVALALVVVACFGVEFEGYLLSWLGIGLGVLVCVVLAARAASARVRSLLRRERDELSAAIGSRAALAQVATASGIAVACHIATFAVAATSVGVNLPPLRLAAIALVVLLAASIPLNVGGWGPREGIAGWAFAVAGLGVAAGVAAATLFGVLTAISVTPGALTHFMIERKHREQQAVRHAEQRDLARRIP